ncbi:hypothetical protein DPMN_175506 [Dreissena polymorpha]|uniref:Uncharacterized protein n=1 Tax=Dreissena polymorpha TaxID=45954 RepID=A0A9D4E5B5_DREPO|nr:hypothetical protein DPMN_175506 [Dreissena polymorpha]
MPHKAMRIMECIYICICSTRSYHTKDNVRRCASRQIKPHRNATAIGRRTAGRSSTHQDRALVPQQILQVCIADLLGDGAVCDPKDSA